MKHVVLALSGPTGSGKTEWGIRLAAELNGAIVVADSRTVYRGLDIGTNKVTYEHEYAVRTTPLGPVYRIQGIDHYGLDLREPADQFTASDFQSYAYQVLPVLWEQHKVPILVGGTGLYIDAVLQGYRFPKKARLSPAWQQRTTDELMQELALWDKATADTIDSRNRARVARALAHAFETGQSFSAAQKKTPPDFTAGLFVIELESPLLAERLDARIDAWIRDGLLDEVRALRANGISEERIRALGFMYTASLDCILGRIDETALRSRLRTDLHRFAKRQLTWWRSHTSATVVRRYGDLSRAARQLLKKS